MSTITFGGLSSGLDSNSIIDKLVAIERSPETALQKRQADAQTLTSVVGSLNTRLQSLSTALKALDSASAIRSLAASSSDSSKVAVTASGAAQPGRYDMTVDQLARAPLRQSQTFSSSAAGAIGAGTLQIQVGSGDPIAITYDASNSIGDIAQQINQAGGGVNASVLFDGTSYRLLVQGSKTGAANELQITETGSGFGLSAPTATLKAASDASVKLNGITVTRPTNVMADVMPGLTFNLGDTTAVGSTVSVTVSDDPDALQKKVQGFVDAFNQVAGSLATQLSYSGTVKGQDTLFGDSASQALQRALGRAVADAYSDAQGSTSAAALGITLGPTGLLTLDATKFKTAASADPLAVQRLLLGSGANGLGKALADISTSYTDPSTGIYTTKLTSIKKQIDGYDDQIAAIERRVTQYQDSLTAQFTQLETLMTGTKSQQSFLDSWEAGLNGSRK